MHNEATNNNCWHWAQCILEGKKEKKRNERGNEKFRYRDIYAIATKEQYMYFLFFSLLRTWNRKLDSMRLVHEIKQNEKNININRINTTFANLFYLRLLRWFAGRCLNTFLSIVSLLVLHLSSHFFSLFFLSFLLAQSIGKYSLVDVIAIESKWCENVYYKPVPTEISPNQFSPIQLLTANNACKCENAIGKHQFTISVCLCCWCFVPSKFMASRTSYTMFLMPSCFFSP